MKLTEKLDFGITLLFRLLLPGGVLTLGLYPALRFAVDLGGWTNQLEYISAVVVILMGCVVVLSDTPIYMALEGRRYWPRRLWNYLHSKEEDRLNEIKDARDRLRERDRRGYLEALADLRKFPLSEGNYEAHFPTRLGNLLAAYEGYSYRVYGMDAVFYWYRIWLKLDKDLRGEIDDQQSIADGAVFTAFASFTAGVLWLIYSVLFTSRAMINMWVPQVKSYLPTFEASILEHLPGFGSWLVALLFFIAGYALYRLSIYLHGKYGETFKSVFDDYQNTIDVSDIVKEVSSLINDPSLVCLDRKEQLKVAWRYLQYNGFRCDACSKLIPIEEMREHNAELHKEVRTGPPQTLSVR